MKNVQFMFQLTEHCKQRIIDRLYEESNDIHGLIEKTPQNCLVRILRWICR